MYKIKHCFLLVLFCAFSFSAHSADSLYEQALQSYQQQKYDEAYVYLKNALQNNPKNLPAKLLLGKVFMQNGFYQEAIKEFREAQSFNIDIELVLLPLGNVLLFNEQYEDVISLGKGYNLTKESLFEWHMLSASAYSNLNKPKLAAQEYEHALNILPNETRVLNSLAYMHLINNDLKQAETYLLKSLKVNANDERTWHLNGKIAEAKNQLHEAIQHYRRALNLDANDPVIMRSKAYALIKDNQINEAKIIADKIIKQTPDDPFAMLLSSWLFSKEDKEGLASAVIEDLNNQLSLVSEERYKQKDSLLFIKGMTAYIQGNFEDARRSLSKYIRNYSHDINAVSMLVEIYTSMGQNSAAILLIEGLGEKLIEHLPQSLKLANLYLETGKDFKAEYWLAELREKYPNNVKIVLMSAKALIARQKLDEAIAIILENESKFPQNTSLKLARGMLYVQTGQFEKAFNIAQVLIKGDKRNPDFWNLQAASALRLKKNEQAEEAIESVLAINPNHFVGRFNQAMLFKNQKKLKEAKVILSTLVEEAPRNSNALFQLAHIKSQTGEVEEAIEKLEVLSIREPGNHKVTRLLLALYSQHGRHQSALNKIRKVTREFPLHPEYAMQKAEILMANRKVDEAKQQLSRLYSLWLDDPQKLYRVSNLQQHIEDFDGATTSLQKALKLLPKHLTLNLQYAKLNLQLGDIESANNVAKNMSQQYGQEPNVLLLKGDILIAENKFDDAYQTYLKTSQLSPGYNTPLFKLYELARRNVKPEHFRQYISELVATNPENKIYRKLLADHLMNTGDWKNAEDHYKKLLTYQELENNFGILNNLANIYLERDLNTAHQYAKKAYNNAPQNPAILDTYGWVLVKLKRYEDAISYLRQAHAINSKDPSNRYHIAYTLSKLGRLEESKTELKELLKEFENFPEKLQAQDLLSST